MSICKRCKTEYDPKVNSQTSCKFHKCDYVCRLHTEGEDYYGVDVGDWDGKFWDCCGKNDPNAPPCAQGKHVSYDDDWEKWKDRFAQSIQANYNNLNDNQMQQEEKKQSDKSESKENVNYNDSPKDNLVNKKDTSARKTESKP